MYYKLRKTFDIIFEKEWLAKFLIYLIKVQTFSFLKGLRVKISHENVMAFSDNMQTKTPEEPEIQVFQWFPGGTSDPQTSENTCLHRRR